ncbi:Hypothetical predicted protein [Lecanosticta acicola]|uniref:Uncharacterized protein n=1 Tax=Lecanosticta acicola TaxID=111012 RepID=A0AAI8Z1F9_9PEZI|nr:Hypothetical predicted protein [Lecanosticta acicola]
MAPFPTVVDSADSLLDQDTPYAHTLPNLEDQEAVNTHMARVMDDILSLKFNPQQLIQKHNNRRLDNVPRENMGLQLSQAVHLRTFLKDALELQQEAGRWGMKGAYRPQDLKLSDLQSVRESMVLAKKHMRSFPPGSYKGKSLMEYLAFLERAQLYLVEAQIAQEKATQEGRDEGFVDEELTTGEDSEKGVEPEKNREWPVKSSPPPPEREGKRQRADQALRSVANSSLADPDLTETSPGPTLTASKASAQSDNQSAASPSASAVGATSAPSTSFVLDLNETKSYNRPFSAGSFEHRNYLSKLSARVHSDISRLKSSEKHSKTLHSQHAGFESSALKEARDLQAFLVKALQYDSLRQTELSTGTIAPELEHFWKLMPKNFGLMLHFELKLKQVGELMEANKGSYDKQQLRKLMVFKGWLQRGLRLHKKSLEQ